MSKLPKPPFEFSLSRKRNIQQQPIPSKSKSIVTTTLTQFNTIDEGMEFGMEDNENPKVGDRVLVDGRQLYGTLRFLGPTEFKPGKWAGVELDDQGTGKNDGSVQGIYYFNCNPNTGIFVPCSKITLVSRCLTTVTGNNKPYVNTSSLSLSSPSPSSPSTVTSLSRSSSSVPITAYPSPQTPTLKKPNSNKNSQRTVVNTNVTPLSSVVESKHVEQEQPYQQIPQRYEIQQKDWIDDTEKKKYRMLIDRHQQEVGSYQVKLGREQHRVYELRKEREHLVQQIYQSNQQLTQQNQIIQQWQESQDRIQHLEDSNRQQAVLLNQLNNTLEQTQFNHRKESAQLMEQQSQLIQELQRERYEHDSIKSTMRHVEQACQGLMDPFDVRPGLALVDQLKETQRQVKDLLEKVRLDTDQKNQQSRDINALHRDVANLESLIETKLFKEADLMESVELERQRNQQLQNQLEKTKLDRRKSPRKQNNKHHSSSIITNTTNKKKNTNNNTNNNNIKKKHVLSLDSGMIDSRWTNRSGETITTSTSSFFAYDDDDDDEDDDDDDLPSYCEICETVGHDLMSCLHTVMDLSEKHKVNNYSTIPSAPHMGTTPILQRKLLPSL